MKTVSVDHYKPFGTNRGYVADFRYRGKLIRYLGYCAVVSDIDAELSRLANRDGFTHWRSVQSGRALKIKGASRGN